MAPIYQTKITIGADYTRLVVFPYAIDGYSFEAKLVSSDGDTVLATFGTSVDTVAKTVTLSLTSAQTSALSAGDVKGYFHQTDTGPKKTPVFDIRARITKPGL